MSRIPTLKKHRALSAQELEGFLQELSIDPTEVRTVRIEGATPVLSDGPSPAHLLVGPVRPGLPVGTTCLELQNLAHLHVTGDRKVLIFLAGKPTEAETSLWRNELWPWLHVAALYRVENGRVEREILQGREILDVSCPQAGTLLVGVRRDYVLSPDSTVTKFNQNASGWNGDPKSSGYAHFRWMRRYVGCFARPKPGEAILDFGCGSGWVGIEAACRVPGTRLRFFDPSPEMVRLAESNAAASGIEDFEGRVGFGEQPPYPAEGEPPFPLVVSSGVISFAPDPDRWADGLCVALAPGGTLVIGDIHRESHGFSARRTRRPLLPSREMNALVREEVREVLERRGLVHEESAGYQLTRPIPQAMHFSDTRLGGLFTRPLLWFNRAAAGMDRACGSPFQRQFDSWVMRFRKPR